MLHSPYLALGTIRHSMYTHKPSNHQQRIGGLLFGVSVYDPDDVCAVGCVAALDGYAVVACGCVGVGAFL